MSYDFLKKALNIKSPSETENPNSEYVPPGCAPKSSDNCSISIDWTGYITITHKFPSKLSGVRLNSAFISLKRYCESNSFDFSMKQLITETDFIYFVFRVPIEEYITFDTSEEYRKFIGALYLSTQKEPEPEMPKPYSGKIVCVSGKEGVFTKGKVYTVKDGTLLSDDGLKHPFVTLPYESVQDINERLEAEFIELIE